MTIWKNVQYVAKNLLIQSLCLVVMEAYATIVEWRFGGLMESVLCVALKLKKLFNFRVTLYYQIFIYPLKKLRK